MSKILALELTHTIGWAVRAPTPPHTGSMVLGDDWTRGAAKFERLMVSLMGAHRPCVVVVPSYGRPRGLLAKLYEIAEARAEVGGARFAQLSLLRASAAVCPNSRGNLSVGGIIKHAKLHEWGQHIDEPAEAVALALLLAAIRDKL